MSNPDRLGQALALAHEAHRTQLRKGSSIPYIAHPMAVSALTLEHGGSEDQAIAALLHDAIEDGGSSYAARIEKLFGRDVLTMVQDCTDGTVESKAAAVTPEEKRADWKTRKLAYLKHLRSKPESTPSLLVSACDKLHNARAVLADYRRLGEPLFDRFTASREQTLWYYNKVAAIFIDKHVAPAASLRHTVEELTLEVQQNEMPMESFVRTLTPPQERFFRDYLAQREASLQQALTELSSGFGRVSREQQQLTGDRHVLA